MARTKLPINGFSQSLPLCYHFYFLHLYYYYLYFLHLYYYYLYFLFADYR